MIPEPEQSSRHKIAMRITKFYLRLGRGHGLIDFIITIIKNVVYLGALDFFIVSRLGFHLKPWMLVLVALTYEAVCYTCGYLDEKYGFWKFQNSYAAEELTPFFGEMRDTIRRIDKNTNKEND